MTTGATSGLGSPTLRSPPEQEQTAATQQARASIGALQESLQVPFSQIDSAAVWKFLSTSSNPTPDAPLINLRMALPLRASGYSWTEEFDRLLDQIPEPLREPLRRRLEYESELPPEERDPSYSAFNRLLGGIARSLVWVRAISSELDDAELSTQKKQFQAGLAQNGEIAFGELLNGGLSSLNAIGHRLINYDDAHNVFGQMQEALSQFEALMKRAQPRSAEDRRSLNAVVEYLSTLNRQVQGRWSGENFQIAKPMLETMSLMAAASTMETGSPQLLIGLSVAMIGINSKDSAAGILSKGFISLKDMFSDLLSSSLLPKADTGSRLLLPLLVTSAFLASVGFIDATKSDAAQGDFPLLLALNFVVSSGLLTTIGTGIVEAGGADEKTKKVGGRILACASLLLMIHAASADNRDLALLLVENEKPYLMSWLNEIEEYASETWYQQGHQTQGDAASLFVQQGRVALEAGDDDAFLQSSVDALKILDQEGGGAWENEIKGLRDLIGKTNPFGSKEIAGFEEALTGITQV